MRLLAKFYPQVLELDREPSGGVRLSDVAEVIKDSDGQK
jgi:hypothetical protein